MRTLPTDTAFDNEQFEDILIYFSSSLLNQASEEEILWDLAKNCIAKLGFADCVVYTIDHKKKTLLQKAAYGPKSPKDYTLYNPVEIPLGKGISGSVALSGTPEIINDTSQDDRYIEDDQERFSEICVPIVIEDDIYGVIDCEHLERNFFTQQHIRMLTAVSAICAIKIKNVRDQNSLLERQKALFQLKAEMMDLKLKALNSNLNPHFVFNALNSIQYFITTEKKREALEYLSIFSKLIRFYLKHLESETVQLFDEIEMLKRYLKLQELRYNKQFKYFIAADEGTMATKAVIPAFLIQTLIEHIIEYAIYNQHQNEVLDIKFSASISNIIFQLRYTYDPIPNQHRCNSEHYRRMVKWQEHIHVLNVSRGYQITKEVIFNKEEHSQGGQIILKLPNLA